ncbi:MAG: hypothetical protein ACRDDH_01980 [Cetobacterium sp.]|uniref:hypothetical protein n=1 Tax=Cetobacterium sp. TaxID=2071632 RepID=UPI003EE521FD
MGKIVATMGQSEWFGFLGSYLGGGITKYIARRSKKYIVRQPNDRNNGIEEVEIIDNKGDRIRELENKLAEYYRKIKDIEYELSILKKKK